MSKELSEREIIGELAKLQENNIPCAMVIIISAKGSTPRKEGAMMIVLSDGTILGTIGGSKVEALLANDALSSISEGKPKRVKYSVSDDEGLQTGMICGGTMEFFVQPFGNFPELIIFGAGHCAVPLCHIASKSGFIVRVFDERPEYVSSSRFPEAIETLFGGYDELIESYDWSKKPYVAILTHSHNSDAEILEKVINKSWTYLGMIGSERKKKQVFKKLKKNGINQELLGLVSTPIGLEIGSETPEEIAVSIVAEMIKVRRS